MRKFFYLLFLISLQACVTVKVNSTDDQNSSFRQIKNPNLSATGTFLDFEKKDDHWSNHNTFNSTQAEFKNSVGNSSIKLKVKKNTDVQFHHQLKIKGEIKMEIINARNEVIYSKNYTNDTEEHFELKLKSGEHIIKWTANDANGSYFLEWKELLKN